MFKDHLPRLGGAALATATLVGWISDARAGAFMVREQSADAVALSMAGAAAGGAGVGSIFWNPATITDFAGWQSSYSVSGIFPSGNITAQPGSALLPLGSSSGNMLQGGVVPASFSTYQLSDKVWIGLANNSPFGQVSANPTLWAGSPYGITSKVFSLDFNPMVGFKVNQYLSIAAGVQAEYFKAYQSQAISLPPPFGPGLQTGVVKGSSWGLGYTLGATLKPWDGTELGVGYRSSVREDIDHGRIAFTGSNPPAQPLPAGTYPAAVNLTLPDEITIGLRQRLTPAFTLLTGFEWDHWSLLGTVPIVNPGPGPLPPTGATYSTINFRFRNGWLASLGGEYQWNDKLILRAGAAYESSPVTDANRQITLPDSDRIWVSLGAGYRLSNKLTADFAYAHLFAKPGTITETVPVAFLATTSAHSDIVSVGLTYRWDAPEAKPIVSAKY